MVNDTHDLVKHSSQRIEEKVDSFHVGMQVSFFLVDRSLWCKSSLHAKLTKHVMLQDIIEKMNISSSSHSPSLPKRRNFPYFHLIIIRQSTALRPQSEIRSNRVSAHALPGGYADRCTGESMGVGRVWRYTDARAHNWSTRKFVLLEHEHTFDSQYNSCVLDQRPWILRDWKVYPRLHHRPRPISLRPSETWCLVLLHAKPRRVFQS